MVKSKYTQSVENTDIWQIRTEIYMFINNSYNSNLEKIGRRWGWHCQANNQARCCNWGSKLNQCTLKRYWLPFIIIFLSARIYAMIMKNYCMWSILIIKKLPFSPDNLKCKILMIMVSTWLFQTLVKFHQTLLIKKVVVCG